VAGRGAMVSTDTSTSFERRGSSRFSIVFAASPGLWRMGTTPLACGNAARRFSADLWFGTDESVSGTTTGPSWNGLRSEGISPISTDTGHADQSTTIANARPWTPRGTHLKRCTR
jgi:hypothetical protein